MRINLLKKVIMVFVVLTMLISFEMFAPLEANAANQASLDNWTWRNPLPTGYTLYSVAYGSGKFVAVGDYGTIMTSTDGATWKE